jgi:hypothetical protein
MPFMDPYLGMFCTIVGFLGLLICNSLVLTRCIEQAKIKSEVGAETHLICGKNDWESEQELNRLSLLLFPLL